MNAIRSIQISFLVVSLFLLMGIDVSKGQYESMQFTYEGYDLIDQKKFSEAIERFDRALEYNQRNFYALSQRGYARLMLGDGNGAYTDINRAIQIQRQPDDFAADNKNLANDYSNKAASEIMMARSGKFTTAEAITLYSSAIEDAKEALRIDPSNTHASGNLDTATKELAILHGGGGQSW